MQWVEFIPDKCVNKVDDPHMAGIFSFRMELHDNKINDKPEWQHMLDADGNFEFKKKKVWNTR